MKTIAAIIASLLLSIVTFTVGLFGAILYLSTPEAALNSRTTEVSDLWTTEPTVVSQNRNQFKRVAARPRPEIRTASSKSSTVERDVLSDDERDRLGTGSIVEQQYPRATTLAREHVQWCMAKFNSYRVDDGTYQPYNGKRRRCVSPHLAVESGVREEEGGAAGEVLLSAHRALGDSGKNVGEVTADLDNHVHKCRQRYRSYRPEDNTYQPFDGGPRRQCQ